MPKFRFFNKLSNLKSHKAGHPLSFALAVGIIVCWVVTGPLFGFSDTWQLVINTATTIVTFLMVFLIQSTQNRDTKALQLKLDELIFVTKKAHNALLDIEELSDEELEIIRKRYGDIAAKARSRLKKKEI